MSEKPAEEPNQENIPHGQGTQRGVLLTPYIIEQIQGLTDKWEAESNVNGGPAHNDLRELIKKAKEGTFEPKIPQKAIDELQKLRDNIRNGGNGEEKNNYIHDIGQVAVAPPTTPKSIGSNNNDIGRG